MGNIYQKRFITYFTNVPFLIFFWKYFENFWFTLSGQREEFTVKDVFVGKLAEDGDLLNNFFILAKFHIWTSRKRRIIPNIETLIGMVDVKYRTEICIAVKNNRRKI